MANFKKEWKVYRAELLVQRRRQIAIRSGILLVLAIALAVVGVFRDDIIDVPVVLIAISTVIVAIWGVAQVSAINRELARRKRL